MLRLRRDLADAVRAHAEADHPDEACGVLAGPEGSDEPRRHVPMANAERSPTFYRFDSGEQLRVWNDMEDRGEEPVVVYHSHTATEAAPSRTDVGLASEPGAHYLLYSTAPEEALLGGARLRSFRIVDGDVTEEPVELVEG